jgi:hypothetical protein
MLKASSSQALKEMSSMIVGVTILRGSVRREFQRREGLGSNILLA